MDAEPGTNRRASRNHLIIKNILRFFIEFVRITVQNFKVAVYRIVSGKKIAEGFCYKSSARIRLRCSPIQLGD